MMNIADAFFTNSVDLTTQHALQVQTLFHNSARLLSQRLISANATFNRQLSLVRATMRSDIHRLEAQVRALESENATLRGDTTTTTPNSPTAAAMMTPRTPRRGADSLAGTMTASADSFAAANSTSMGLDLEQSMTIRDQQQKQLTLLEAHKADVSRLNAQLESERLAAQARQQQQQHELDDALLRVSQLQDDLDEQRHQQEMEREAVAAENSLLSHLFVQSEFLRQESEKRGVISDSAQHEFIQNFVVKQQRFLLASQRQLAADCDALRNLYLELSVIRNELESRNSIVAAESFAAIADSIRAFHHQQESSLLRSLFVAEQFAHRETVERARISNESAASFVGDVALHALQHSSQAQQHKATRDLAALRHLFLVEQLHHRETTARSAISESAFGRELISLILMRVIDLKNLKIQQQQREHQQWQRIQQEDHNLALRDREQQLLEQFREQHEAQQSDHTASLRRVQNDLEQQHSQHLRQQQQFQNILIDETQQRSEIADAANSNFTLELVPHHIEQLRVAFTKQIEHARSEDAAAASARLTAEHSQHISLLQQQHVDAMSKMEEAFAAQSRQREAEFEQQRVAAQRENETQMQQHESRMQAEHQGQVEQLRVAHERQLSLLRDAHQEQMQTALTQQQQVHSAAMQKAEEVLLQQFEQRQQEKQRENEEKVRELQRQADTQRDAALTEQQRQHEAEMARIKDGIAALRAGAESSGDELQRTSAQLRRRLSELEEQSQAEQRRAASELSASQRENAVLRVELLESASRSEIQSAALHSELFLPIVTLFSLSQQEQLEKQHKAAAAAQAEAHQRLLDAEAQISLLRTTHAMELQRAQQDAATRLAEESSSSAQRERVIAAELLAVERQQQQNHLQQLLLDDETAARQLLDSIEPDERQAVVIACSDGAERLAQLAAAQQRAAQLQEQLGDVQIRAMEEVASVRAASEEAIAAQRAASKESSQRQQRALRTAEEQLAAAQTEKEALESALAMLRGAAPTSPASSSPSPSSSVSPPRTTRQQQPTTVVVDELTRLRMEREMELHREYARVLDLLEDPAAADDRSSLLSTFAKCSPLPALWQLGRTATLGTALESRSLVLTAEKRLRKVDLGGGFKMTGVIDFTALSRLSCLEWLDISRTGVAGEFCAALLPRSLKWLYANSCNLTGDLSDLSDLPPRLAVLHLYNNPALGKKKKNSEIIVAVDETSLSSHFDLYIPASLVDINLSSCALEGELRIKFAARVQQSMLASLNLSNNSQLTGDITSSVFAGGLPERLERIILSSCGFAGSVIWALVGQATSLVTLDLANNVGINGPLRFAELPRRMQLLKLQNCRFDGPVSLSELSELKELACLDVSNNRLEGVLTFSRLPPKLKSLSLGEGNSFGGSLDLSQLSHLTRLESLDLARLGNVMKTHTIKGLDSTAAAAAAALPPSLKQLVLHSNAFTGTVSAEVVAQLQLVDLRWCPNIEFVGDVGSVAGLRI